MVDPKFEKPNTIEEIRKIGGWSSNNEKLLRNEKDRAAKQKERNDEYLPIFEAFYKVLQYMNEK